MGALEFGIEVIAVSASGVLAPGPLFVANLLYGTRQGAAAGLKIAYGHTAVELPLIILIAAGVFSYAAIMENYSGAIGVIGGLAILAFAGLQVARIWRNKSFTLPGAEGGRSPLMAGIVFSALNPFFLIWWFTVGLKLIADSTEFGPAAGVALLFGLHIWMDYAWLGTTAYLASKGTSVIKSKYYPVLLLVLSGALVYYGVNFLLTSLS
ncbi:MAG TPA: LysE family transporter [Nitrososphaera sp.]|nr:LysE family transporter [Nitrososphaera sp.]